MHSKAIFANRFQYIGHSDVAAILQLAERPEVISFAGGLPDPHTFLLDEARELTAEVLAATGQAALGYGPTAGIKTLRTWLAEHMTRQGRPTSIEETVVTTGGIAALDLICKSVLDAGDTVVVGEPAYVAALHVFRSYQARFAGVPLDESGMQTDALRDKLRNLQRQSIYPKLLYLVPSFQNPAGLTLSIERRKALLDIAREFGLLVIEDAAYRDLRFEGEAPPLMAALDPENVLHINTFSKVFNPGVRIGWACGPRHLIDALILAKQGQDQCSSTIGQYLTTAFAQSGLIEKQIARAVGIYKRKRDVMLSALAEALPAATRWTRPEGGFYTWVTLPDGVDTEKLLPASIEQAKVAYVPGPAFYHDRSGQNHLRLCYSYVPEAVIEQGVQRLGQLITDAL